MPSRSFPTGYHYRQTETITRYTQALCKGGYELKKLCLIASILPLFGCSNFNDDSKKKFQSVNKQQLSSNAEKDRLKDSSLVNNKSSSPYTSSDRNDQLLKIKNTSEIRNAVNTPPKESALLNVDLIKQNPELKYGCEVTSLAMVLNYAGIKTTKMDLYHAIEKDPDPLIKSPKGDIIQWGNPADGFVGDMTGTKAGYAVFDKPMINLINQKLPGRAVNLTNQPFERVLEHVSSGYPVVVWTTGDYRLPDRQEGWHHGNQYIKTPLDLHAVVLVGYDSKYVYINDPLSGRKQAKVGKEQFISSWNALQKRAVSYK